MTTHKAQASQPKSLDFSTVRFIQSKPVKRRASQACIQCRNRKVRCDYVLQSPGFCTNCRLDGVVCEVSRCRRRRPHRVIATSTIAPGTITSQDGTTSTPSTSTYNEASRDEEARTAEAVMEVAQLVEAPVNNDARNQPSPIPLFIQPAFQDEKPPMISLPRFINPLSTDLDEEDARYLTKRGCFEFPPPDLEKIVLRRYAEFVHPLVPVHDLDDFVGIVFGTLDKKISLLLYHAVMCAGLAAVEIDTILKFGFESKPVARREYYLKAKTLFDLDAETDRLAACQAAILFISWASNKHSKDAFYWVGVAISQACSLKLQKPESCANLPKAEQMLRQRIWWTIMMKECDVCLSMGRPPRISPIGYPPLQQEAFMNNSRAIDYSDLPETGKLRRDPWIQRRIEMACIEKAKLSLIMYRLLRLPRGGPDASGTSSNRSSRIWQLEAELKDWRLQLPTELNSFNPALNLSDDADRSLQMAVSIIHLTQLMAIIMLHKGEVSMAIWTECPENNDEWLEDEGGTDVQGHTRSMRQAAHEMTVIHKALHHQRMTPSIPTIGVATVCAAVFVHLLDARSNRPSIRKNGLEQLDVCLSVLRELGQINETATDVTRIVESAVQAAREFSTSPNSQRPHILQGQNAGSYRSRSSDELQCTTHSYMEGVMPGQSESQVPEASAENQDLLASGGQDLFYGMEAFFDFEIEENLMFLADI